MDAWFIIVVMQVQQPNHNSLISHYIKQAVFALILGCTLFVVTLGVIVLAIQVWFAGRIFPGIQVNQINLGGLSVDSALQQIQLSDTYTNSSNLILQFQENSWEVTPAQLGFSFDPGATLQKAYQVGRYGSIIQWLIDTLTLWNPRRPISPVYTFNQQIAADYLQQLARQINQPVLEASLEVQGTQILAKPGQIGLLIDIPATLTGISDKVSSQEAGEVPIIFTVANPEIMDVSEYAEAARSILSTSLVLTAPGDLAHSSGPWTLLPEVLANMLVFEKIRNENGIVYDVKLNESILNEYLLDLAEQVNFEPENPRFIFNDDTRQLDLLQPGIRGQNLNVAESVKSIQDGLRNNNHSIQLAFTFIQPDIADEVTADQLGIHELLHAETSYFYGSSSARIQNISVAAGRFHGLLVPPNTTFSMAEVMGDISLDTGYTEALIIYNGQTIEGVGGGVCQVSTTLFRTAFFGGFPITERHPHAYRVKYYEKTAGNSTNSILAGLDATVYVPLVDLKFTNDTPFWLLMETYVIPANNSITWKFYSSSDGRSVDWETTGPTNLVEPPKPLYKENSALDNGEIKQVDWEAQGADITVNRMVFRGGVLYFQDSFITHYEPWRAVYEYGPGTEGIPQQTTP